MPRSCRCPAPVARCLALLVAILGIAPARPAFAAPAAQAAAGGPIDARIEIVWPHDAQGHQVPVARALLVNVEVYLFQRGTLDPVDCDFAGTPTLHFTVNEQYYGQGHGTGGDQTVGDIEPVQAQRITRTVDGKSFPVWVFNDVPISPPSSTPYISNVTTYFFVDVLGYDSRTNVWGHGADPRTFEPGQTIALRTAADPVTSVDSIIQIVWPRDRQGRQAPVAQAPLANVAVDLFRHPRCLTGAAGPGSCNVSVGFDFRQPVHLLQALNGAELAPVAIAPQITNAVVPATITPVVWPRWQFNDVDVSAAGDPANKYYFAVQVDGVENHTTIWAHGADARTNFPRRDVPTSSGAGC